MARDKDTCATESEIKKSLTLQQITDEVSIQVAGICKVLGIEDSEEQHDAAGVLGAIQRGIMGSIVVLEDVSRRLDEVARTIDRIGIQVHG